MSIKVKTGNLVSKRIVEVANAQELLKFQKYNYWPHLARRKVF